MNRITFNDIDWILAGNAEITLLINGAYHTQYKDKSEFEIQYADYYIIFMDVEDNGIIIDIDRVK